jgi:predicted thioesterase
MDFPGIELGLKAEEELIVANEHTAPHVGSGAVPVLATPVLINMFEAAALAAVEELLPEGYPTVGTRLDVRHYAATPVGMRVHAHAQLVAVEGRMLHFRLNARDEREPIGEGWHERIIIKLGRFDQRMADKLAGN